MSETLRIALIGERASPPGASPACVGQSVYVARLAHCLARAGHQVDVLAPGDRPTTTGPGRPCDVVHANVFTAGALAQRLKRAEGTPFVMSFHGLGLADGDDAHPDPERVAIERALVRDADAIVAGSAQERADLLHHYGAEPAQVSMLPCGVDTLAFCPFDKATARDRLGLDPHAFIVLRDRLPLQEGQAHAARDSVARAFARLRRDIPARLLALDAGSRGRETLRLHYAAADVFVAVARHDPLGITSLESMACGTPVIGSAAGALRHVVRDGETGFLVPPDDPHALAARLAQLHDHPALARAMGRAGVRRARSMFTWERLAHQLVDVYHGVRRGHAAGQASVPAWRHLRLVRPGQAILPAGAP